MRNLILNNLLAALPSLNVTEHTEEDFERLCADLGIRVRFVAISGADGAYIENKGRRYIFINHRLRGFRRIFTAYHELGHALLHVPCCGGERPYERRYEREADEFAMLSIMPKAKLADFLHLQHSPSAHDREIFRNRLRLYYDYGL